MALAKHDIVGTTVGFLTVLDTAGEAFFLCRCTCGIRIRVSGGSLRCPKGRRACSRGCAVKQRAR